MGFGNGTKLGMCIFGRFIVYFVGGFKVERCEMGVPSGSVAEFCLGYWIG